jgi:hypothetical protein
MKPKRNRTSPREKIGSMNLIFPILVDNSPFTLLLRQKFTIFKPPIWTSTTPEIKINLILITGEGSNFA